MNWGKVIVLLLSGELFVVAEAVTEQARLACMRLQQDAATITGKLLGKLWAALLLECPRATAESVVAKLGMFLYLTSHR